jgi:hypothetical protein
VELDLKDTTREDFEEAFMRKTAKKTAKEWEQ